jgi:hypothetical protein
VRRNFAKNSRGIGASAAANLPKASGFARGWQVICDSQPMRQNRQVRQGIVEQLEFWNALRKYDSLFQKSPILAPAGCDRAAKQVDSRLRMIQKTSNSRL